MSHDLLHTIQRLHCYPAKTRQHYDDIEMVLFSKKIYLSQERRSTKRKITIKELDSYIKIAAAYYFGFKFANTKDFLEYKIFCVETLTFDKLTPNQLEYDTKCMEISHDADITHNNLSMIYIDDKDDVYKLTQRTTTAPDFPNITPILTPTWKYIQNRLDYTKYCNFFVKYLKTEQFGFLNSILLKYFNVYLNAFERRFSDQIDANLCPTSMDFSIATCLFNIIQLICQ